MRNIICDDCIARRPVGLHPEDAAMGFQKRVVELRVKKPADHAITINGVKQEQMASIMCDDCGKPIPDGSRAFAISMWTGDFLADWEHEYGEVTQ